MVKLEVDTLSKVKWQLYSLDPTLVYYNRSESKVPFVVIWPCGDTVLLIRENGLSWDARENFESRYTKIDAKGKAYIETD